MKRDSDSYARFYGPILDALRALGGSGTPKEVKAWIIADQGFTDEQLAVRTKTGSPAIENEIHWARQGLVNLGFLEGSVRGVWALTPAGASKHLTLDEAKRLRRDMQRGRYSAAQATAANLPAADDSPDEPDAPDSPARLLDVLRDLPPAGFEKLCQRILREAGFSEVHVTGKTGDGGIDGHGTLVVNSLVSFRVLFQCKRYQGTVSSKEIRDFHGTMMGRTDKGIFLTTGTFSRDAKEEAVRPGTPPIELVDGDRLVELMENLRLGVIPRTVYDVDHRFMEEFSS